METPIFGVPAILQASEPLDRFVRSAFGGPFLL
jgi:hypothetical protein